jgi:hypothetical protein
MTSLTDSRNDSDETTLGEEGIIGRFHSPLSTFALDPRFLFIETLTI